MTNASRNPNADFRPEMKEAAAAASSVAGSVADKTSRLARDLTDRGSEALETAKDAVTGAMSDVAAGAGERIDAARNSIADGGERIADKLRSASQDGEDGMQARVLDSVASGLDSASEVLRAADVSQMAASVRRFAQRNPALFAAGAAIAGLVVARAISGAYSGRGRSEGNGAHGNDDFADRFYDEGGRDDTGRAARL